MLALPFSFKGQKRLVASEESRAEDEFACSKEEALYGKGTVHHWTELCVSCFLLGWHLICSRDQVPVTLSIEAFAVVVSREACITYSCGFLKLSLKNMFECRLVFPFPNVFHLLDILFVISSEAKISGVLGSLYLKEKKVENPQKGFCCVCIYFFVCRVFRCSILNG